MPILWDYFQEVKELTVDLFTYTEPDKKILRCVTTNGVVRKNGELTMGAGVALQAHNLYPRLAKALGNLVSKFGNLVYVIQDLNVASFPTKHHWKEDSDIKLIEESAKQLVKVAKDYDLVLLTRPGCGLGNLKWEEVKKVIEPILQGDKFVVCHGQWLRG